MRVIQTAPRTQRPLRTGPRQSTGRGRAGRRGRGRDRAEKRVLAGSQRTGGRGSQRFSVARLGTGRAVGRSVGAWGRPVAKREGSPIPGIPSRVECVPVGDQPAGRSGATEPNVAREISERVGGPGAMNRQHSEVVLQRNAHSVRSYGAPRWFCRPEKPPTWGPWSVRGVTPSTPIASRNAVRVTPVLIVAGPLPEPSQGL